MYFAIVTSCNRITPIVLCASDNCASLLNYIEDKLDVSVTDLKKFNTLGDDDVDKDDEDKDNSDNENELPLEFSELPSELVEHVITYNLGKEEIKKAFEHDIVACTGCGGYIGIFKSDYDVVDFGKILTYVQRA
jgi:hypothetical protein